MIKPFERANCLCFSYILKSEKSTEKFQRSDKQGFSLTEAVLPFEGGNIIY